MEATVAGMELPGDNDIVQPLAAVVVIKGLDADNRIAYWSRATDDLSTTEALGMAMGLVDDLRETRTGKP